MLERDPKNINSVKGIAYLYLQMKKFEDAKTFYRKALEHRSQRSRAVLLDRRDRLDPELPAPHGRTRQAGLKPDEWIMKDKSNKKVCDMLKDEELAESSTTESPCCRKALTLRPDYDDAMAYLNLLYREKGDLECDDAGARAADLKTADEWVTRPWPPRKPRPKSSPALRASQCPANRNARSILTKPLLQKRLSFQDGR